jgi:hypothetical protein
MIKTRKMRGTKHVARMGEKYVGSSVGHSEIKGILEIISKHRKLT